MCSSTVIPEPVQGLGNDDGLLGRTALCKLLMEKTGLHDCKCFWTTHHLKYIFFFTLNIHIMLGLLMLPASAAVKYLSMFICMYLNFSAFGKFFPPYMLLFFTACSADHTWKNHTGQGVTVSNNCICSKLYLHIHHHIIMCFKL